MVNSLMVAVTAFALTIMIGVPFAFCVARLPIGGKAVLLALAALPLVLPSFVSAYALVLMFGRGGIVTGAMHSIGIPFESIYGMKGIITTYTLTLYPYVVLPTVAALRSVDVSIEEAAQNLGSSQLRMLRTVTLPIVMPSILAGGLLVFIEAIENFGVPFVLAEDMPILAVETFKLFVGETAANPSSAGVLGMLLLFCTIVALLVQRNVLARRYYATGARRAPPLLVVSRRLRIAGSAYCWTVIAAALVPFAAVIVISFMRFSGPVLHYEFSLDNFAQLLQRSYQAAGQYALSLDQRGVCRDFDRRADRLLLVRGARACRRCWRSSPPPVCGCGNRAGHRLVLTYNSGPVILTGTSLIMVIAYAVSKLPFSVRSSSAICSRLTSASRRPRSVWRRHSPPSAHHGALDPRWNCRWRVLSFVTIASELSSTVVLYSGPWITMTVTMFKALEGSSAGEATAAATILMLFTVLPVVLVYRLLRRFELSLLS